MQEFTEKDCMQTEKEALSRTGWWFFPQRYYQSITQGSFFSVRISRKQKIPDTPLPIWFPYLLGRHGTAGTGMWLVCCGQNCWGKGTTPALPDPSIWALDLHGHSPEYSGYSFLPDGRYASGVWLVNPEEVWSYVMMQKDYQYRILICDRDDFAVLEMLEGR